MTPDGVLDILIGLFGMGAPAFIATKAVLKGKFPDIMHLPTKFFHREKEPFLFWMWVFLMYAAFLLAVVFFCVGLKYGFRTKHDFLGH